MIVTAHRSRGRGNPIALFFSRLTGQAAGSATARVVATIGKRVVGVRSFEDVHVPGLPMAILAKDVGCKRRDTWDIQIEQRQGQDRYSYDSQAEQVTSGPDGIPEIVLRTQAGSSAENVLLVDLGNNLRADVAARQIQDGLSIRELELVGGELRLDDLPKRLAADCMFSSRTLGALEGIIGQCRICLLYENFQPSMGRRYGHADCTRLIAGRVMDMQSCHQGMMEIIFQPGVIATRTALLADADGDPHSGSCEENRYIFKLCLTQ